VAYIAFMIAHAHVPVCSLAGVIERIIQALWEQYSVLALRFKSSENEIGRAPAASATGSLLGLMHAIYQPSCICLGPLAQHSNRFSAGGFCTSTAYFHSPSSGPSPRGLLRQLDSNELDLAYKLVSVPFWSDIGRSGTAALNRWQCWSSPLVRKGGNRSAQSCPDHSIIRPLHQCRRHAIHSSLRHSGPSQAARQDSEHRRYHAACPTLLNNQGARPTAAAYQM
jgi:hypothetical protein